MNIRNKRLLIGGLAALVVVIALLILPYASRLSPAVLNVHISGMAWDRVTVTTQFVTNAPTTFSPPEEIIVSPISYGPYYIQIDYADEQKFWIHYYHTDAGIRRKVDIYLDGLPENNTVAVRAVAYGDNTIYSNTVSASGTTKEKPVDIQ